MGTIKTSFLEIGRLNKRMSERYARQMPREGQWVVDINIRKHHAKVIIQEANFSKY